MTAANVAVVFSDSHLAPRAWTNREIYGDSYYALEQIVDAAISLGIPMIGAGDLIDKSVNGSDPIVVFQQHLHRLQAAGLYLAYTQGQHELSDPAWLSGHQAAIHLHGQCLDIGGINISGLDYQPAGKLQDALDGVSELTDVLIAHQVWSDFMGSIANPQGSFSDVSFAKLMVTGDLHETKTVKARGKQGQVFAVASPGSTCMQDIAEPPVKSFYILRGDLSLTKVPLRSRPMIDAGLLASAGELDFFLGQLTTLLAQAEATTDGFPAHIRKPLLRVAYSYKISEAGRRIRQAVGDRAFLFPKENPPEPAPEVMERRKAAEIAGTRRVASLDGLLEEYLTANRLIALTTPSRRLLQSEDVAAELRLMREEALA